ncbi:MAG: DUF2231 domain-containing protein [Anaerolineae bacterium]
MMDLLDRPLHPIVVHFPISLYLLGVLMTTVYLWRRRVAYDQFAYWSFLLAWPANLVASLMGLIDQNRLDYLDPRRDAINNHITAGVVLLILNGLVIYMRFRWPGLLREPGRRWQYLALMLAGVAALVVTGWLGGELVYQLRVGIE